jgi:hypothetical protein
VCHFPSSQHLKHASASLSSGSKASFVNLLKLGFVLPGRSASLNGSELRSIRDTRRTDGSRRVFVLFLARDFASDGSDIVDRQFGLAVQNAYPVLAIADERDQIPPVLVGVADLILVCRPVTPGLLAETMKVVLGRVIGKRLRHRGAGRHGA